ncbi:MAG: beta-galactosidase [Clostridium sp.]|nr:beta-galactosidase [Clostridium sp.]MCM1399488.1 beta-galactosidase [Clostridium sp.]MCM1460042.1 beta-galactosidase [Bacteroides sp.]
MWLGVDYYPEQWDISMLEEDLDTIVELGCNVIRIAEFSWHLMEKKEGEFDFSYFDNVIAKAKKKGLKVIMGTPTATIPAWLAKKHPTILSEFEGGKKRSFGGRHVFCFSSPHMYEYSEKIVRALVEHYKGEEAIVAWQIDNEIGHEGSDVCFCENCQRKFQNFLNVKFNGDIDKLNDTYGTTFWSQEYNSFDEIPVPSETITTHNPALRLDWERFRSKLIVDFIDFQARLIKGIDKGAVVMHDFPGGGLTKHVDYSKVAKTIVQVAYNNYPVWGGQKEPLPPHEIAFGLDYIRGLKGKNFWITEAIMGAQGHDITGFLPRPNQAKMWSYQGMAHGCDSLMYFRYRGATKGAEQFCYGILDADNVKRRRFYEVQTFFEDISKYGEALHAPIKNEVAIVYDYDSLASFRIQRQSILLDNQAEMQKFYKAFYDVNVGVDIIPEDRSFDGYKVIILPQLIITKKEMEDRVKAFVENGGTVILTYRCAVKDADNNVPFGKTMPVNYNDITGINIVETESLQELDAFPVTGRGEFCDVTGHGGIFRDMIEAEDAETLFNYDDNFYKGYAAVTRKRNGRGSVYYVGCGLEERILAKLMDTVMKENGIAQLYSGDGVEIVTRGNEKQQIKMYINHNDRTVIADGIELLQFECKIVE